MRKSLTLWLCVLIFGATGAEVVLAATFDGNACKGTWVVREKASGNAAVEGTWSVAKK